MEEAGYLHRFVDDGANGHRTRTDDDEEHTTEGYDEGTSGDEGDYENNSRTDDEEASGDDNENDSRGNGEDNSGGDDDDDTSGGDGDISENGDHSNALETAFTRFRQRERLAAVQARWKQRLHNFRGHFTQVTALSALECVWNAVAYIFHLKGVIYLALGTFFALWICFEVTISTMCTTDVVRMMSTRLPYVGLPDFCTNLDSARRSERLYKNQMYESLDSTPQYLGPASNLTIVFQLADHYSVESWTRLNDLKHFVQSNLPHATDIHLLAKSVAHGGEQIQTHVNTFRLMDSAFRIKFDGGIRRLSYDLARLLHAESQSRDLSNWVYDQLCNWNPSIFTSSQLGLFMSRYVDFLEESIQAANKLSNEALAFGNALLTFQSGLHQLRDALQIEQQEWLSRCLMAPEPPSWFWPRPQSTGQLVRYSPSCGIEPVSRLEPLEKSYEFITFLVSINAQAYHDFKQVSDGLGFVKWQLQTYHERASTAIYGRLPPNATLPHTINALAARRLLSAILPEINAMHGSIHQMRAQTKSNFQNPEDREKALREELRNWVPDENHRLKKEWKPSKPE